MTRPILFATNRAARAVEREQLPALISRAHFGGRPITVKAVKVTDTHRVYAATEKEF